MGNNDNNNFSSESYEDNNDLIEDEENSPLKRRIDEKEREGYLYELFDKRQTKRYETCQSSRIEHQKKKQSTQKLECPRVKKIIQNILGEGVQVTNLVQIIMHGVAKLYAGELVEEAKGILVNEKETKNQNNGNDKNDKNANNDDKELTGKKRSYSPIKPRHLREARRRMIERGILPTILNDNNGLYKRKKII